MLIDRIQTGLARNDSMGDVIPVTDYLPPHKMPGYVPYDGVVPLYDQDSKWSVEAVGDQFDEYKIPYDEVIGIDKNDSQEDGELLAFVKFRSQRQHEE